VEASLINLNVGSCCNIQERKYSKTTSSCFCGDHGVKYLGNIVLMVIWRGSYRKACRITEHAKCM